ncbi:hypothetical protein P4O66_001010 [Electrophorus voltai]|uniref:ribonuclease H n=1 Tax=Electrophorus voltai TaxID=2609070 RepID=A0AAD8Z9F0_9TELE|nr:hypothetical protein P4O66_001010 [Electrophorus voltai]
MEQYITEALKQGYVHPSKSPASASVFFVKRKRVASQDRVDYGGLNQLLLQHYCPLPLFPAALLRGAKLDLCSAYNLIRFKEGDKWKTAFSTSTGHYEYLVLPYGLATAPSIFQVYINKVLREFLGRSVLAYIDDIFLLGPTCARRKGCSLYLNEKIPLLQGGKV